MYGRGSVRQMRSTRPRSACKRGRRHSLRPQKSGFCAGRRGCCLESVRLSRSARDLAKVGNPPDEAIRGSSRSSTALDPAPMARVDPLQTFAFALELETPTTLFCDLRYHL